MNLQTEIAISKANRHIQNLAFGVSILNELPELRDIYRIHVSDMQGAVFIVAPYNLETYRHNRKVLYNAGWTVNRAFTVPSGNRYAHLKKGDDERISYIMEPDIEGSTCKKVKVAEEIAEIFQVACE